MPRPKVSEEVDPDAELQAGRHLVPPLRLDGDAVVKLEPGDAAQPEMVNS